MDTKKLWNKLGRLSRFLIITLICGILFMCYLYAFELDLSDWKSKEENYNALETIMYEMIEEKKFTMPLSENLSSYSVNAYSNGKIDVALHSNGIESIYVTLSPEFKLIELKRSNSFGGIIIVHILLLFFCGFILSIMVHIIYYLIIKNIILFIRFCTK